MFPILFLVELIVSKPSPDSAEILGNKFFHACEIIFQGKGISTKFMLAEAGA